MLFSIGLFLKGAEGSFVSAVVVKHRKREVGLLVSAKLMAAAKELMVSIVHSKILTAHSKIFSLFLLDSNKCHCVVIVNSYMCSFLFKGELIRTGALIANFCPYPGVIRTGAAIRQWAVARSFSLI